MGGPGSQREADIAAIQATLRKRQGKPHSEESPKDRLEKLPKPIKKEGSSIGPGNSSTDPFVIDD